jgi:multidrug efflux pump subunit AcrB
MSEHKQFGFTSWCIENRTAVYIFTIIISLMGFRTFNTLPKEQFPDIVVPTIYISTIHPGTTPSDVENLLTKPIEKQVKAVSGVKKVTSSSIQDFSAVIVEFNTDIDPDVAKQKVSDAVDKAKSDLPNDLKNDPVVQEIAFSEFPIMQVNVAGNYDLFKLKDYAEDIKDEIESLKEITRVDIIGAPTKEIHIDLDLYKMQAAGITFSDLETSIAQENVNISGGEIRVNDLRRGVRVIGEFKDVEQIANLAIKNAFGNYVYIRDIADVSISQKEKQDFARLDNQSVISLNVIKRAGQNLISASENINEKIESLKQGKLPSNLDITITGDQADFTKNQLNDLINSVIIGFLLVVLILMFFMGVQQAVFVGLAVPLSSLLALLLMPSLGFTLNVVVLFSFLLSLGIVVDDAIVVIENTHRLFHTGKYDIKTAAKLAAGEVIIPVFAGTLTTIAPFFPLIFWPGIIGEFMKYLPITLIITLFASLFVAFVINPVFAVDFMSDDTKKGKKKSFLKLHLKKSILLLCVAILGYISHSFALGNLAAVTLIFMVLFHFVFEPIIIRFQTKTIPAFMAGYKKLLSIVISNRNPIKLMVGMVVLFVLTIMIFGAKTPKVDFFPQGEPNFTYVYIKLPIGTDANVTDSITKIIEKRVNTAIEPSKEMVKSIITNIGIGAGDPQNPDRTTTPHKGKITVAYKQFNKRNGLSTTDAMEAIRAAMPKIPSVEITVDKDQGGPPQGKPVSIEIAGEEFDSLVAISQRIDQIIDQSGIKGIEELKSDLILNKPELIVNIDREKAMRQGISTVSAALAVRTAIYGKDIAKFRETDKESDIIIKLKDEYKTKPEDIMNLIIAFRDMNSGQFKQIPISTIASVSQSNTYSGINRKNQKRIVTLSSNLLTGYNANEVNAEIQELFSDYKMSEGYILNLAGAQEDQAETQAFLGFAMLSALALVFLILVTQFNSTSKPFIIFITIFLSLIGVLLGFSLSGQTMSIVMTGVGVIALAGIVVKNGIILIEFTDELLSRGYRVRRAITEAASTRLTPVLLTAATTILGLVPLAIGLNVNFVTLFTEFDPEFFIGGDSVAFWGPLAWTIIYGLAFSSFLTLFVVPALYLMTYRLKQKIRRGKIRRKIKALKEA